MRTLLIDVGNSRMKMALTDGIQIRTTAVQPHAGDPAGALAEIPVMPVAAIWIANVTGAEHGQQLREALQLRYGVEMNFAETRAECCGLRVAYDEPERLGVDRWLAMLALWTRDQKAFAVASAGTALTFDAVDNSGAHLGGVIAPGLYAAQQAVRGSTRFDVAEPDLQFATGLGRDTEACVRQGALHAAAGLLERLAERHAPPPATLALGGGDAATLLPHLSSRWSAAPDLVMEGLLRLAKSHP